jgi:hypothetical protein
LSSQDTFADRLETAAKAKQALLDRARAKDRTKDPEFVARQEARAAAARAREEREIERRNAEIERRNAQRLEKEAARAKAAADEEARKAEAIVLAAKQAKSSLREQIELLAEQKATRDARYAARKARKKP